MSEKNLYTTGDAAKECGVSVRTVQYYDARGLLNPSGLSEGGRRLYSDSDIERLKIICFLRSLDISLEGIRTLLSEQNSERVISLLLDKQESALRSEISQKQEQVEKIGEIKRALSMLSRVSPESIGDIAHIMKNKKEIRRMRIIMLAVGFLMDVIQVSTLMVWIFRGIWLPFVLGVAVAAALGVWVSCYYFTRTVYICPECHTVFKPTLKESLFARHTPHTRRLRCKNCSYHGFCVETYGGKNAEN